MAKEYRLLVKLPLTGADPLADAEALVGMKQVYDQMQALIPPGVTIEHDVHDVRQKSTKPTVVADASQAQEAAE